VSTIVVLFVITLLKSDLPVDLRNRKLQAS